jgi:hypothetical protein
LENSKQLPSGCSIRWSKVVVVIATIAEVIMEMVW